MNIKSFHSNNLKIKCDKLKSKPILRNFMAPDL